MTNYYFLSSMLPELQVGSPPDLPFAELEPLLSTNLKPKDVKMAETVRRFYDIQNIRDLWKEQPLSPYGNLEENEIEEALLTRGGLPEYVYDYMDRHPDLDDRIHYFPSLVVSYFNEEISHAKGFLLKFLNSEREWRLVLVGFRAKQLKRDLGQELQFEDPADTIVAQMLAQKDAKTFEPPEAYEDLKALFESKLESPLELHKALCEYRFEKISEMLEREAFSLDRVLGYLCQLIIVEQWLELDKKKGIEIVDTIVRDSA